MEFNESRNIFLQIEDWLNERILLGEYKPNDRIPSVRELAEEMEVNRNTVMRTYSNMESQGILENKRGVGFFVSEKAPKEIKEIQKKEFFDKDLPKLINKIKLLKLSAEDLGELILALNHNRHEN
ncbi:MAG TPA: GntR family transcriptional regulator [Anditalea sp.]|nr:GntR family transcriptional regulator [Anditalea sp.]